MFSWHKGTEHIIITYALMISTWTLFFYQLEDMKRAWEKITNFQSFYLVLQSTNIIIRPWSSQSIGNNFSVKALFHKFWMPLKFWHIWHRKLFYSIHIFTSIDCSILSCQEIWNIQLISLKHTPSNWNYRKLWVKMVHWKYIDIVKSIN